MKVTTKIQPAKAQPEAKPQPINGDLKAAFAKWMKGEAGWTTLKHAYVKTHKDARVSFKQTFTALAGVKTWAEAKAARSKALKAASKTAKAA